MILIPPPPRNSLAELQAVIDQYENPVNPGHMQVPMDKDLDGLFSKLLRRNGLPGQRRRLKLWAKALVPVVLYHKAYFSRLRPDEYARRLRLPVRFDQLESSIGTASYPSGHTVQAYVLAIRLSRKYPHLRDHLMELAKAISLSRVDRGVHFPSDLDGGYQLALKLT
jgi:membrane-associated phospholipid phosphatase